MASSWQGGIVVDFDWGDGEYERTAAVLRSAAYEAVRFAGVRGNERVLDLGCGTGNAAIAAAPSGAMISAIDPSERLLRIAQERFRSRRLSIPTAVGRAESIPFENQSFDVIIAVFSIIFARDPLAAVREVRRVLSDSVRFVLTSWIPEGPIHRLSKSLFADFPKRPKSPWERPHLLEELFSSWNASMRTDEREVIFEADSSKTWFDELVEHHPVWRAVRKARVDRWADICRESLAILDQENENRSAFRVTTRYLLVRLDCARLA